jgi:hypothetical protein
MTAPMQSAHLPVLSPGVRMIVSLLVLVSVGSGLVLDKTSLHVDRQSAGSPAEMLDGRDPVLSTQEAIR